MAGAAVVAGQTAGGIAAIVCSMDSCRIGWCIVMGPMPRVSIGMLVGSVCQSAPRSGHAVLLAKRHGDRAVALYRQPQRKQRD